TSVVNAFATPGHVYATRGFLARLENEAQFAAVMGHELGHVTAGHTAKQFTTSILTSLALGVADFAAGESAAGQLAVGAGQFSITMLGFSYSREQERQVDRVGAYYMALAGWDPRQAIAMQRLLASLSTRKGTVLDKYLSTHTDVEDRIAEIESVIAEKDLARRYLQGYGIYAGRWERRLEPLRRVDGAFGPYDKGVKLLAERKFEQALAAAEQSIAMRADQAQFYSLKGDALRGLKGPDEALAAYRQSLGRDPRYVPANIGLGLVFLGQEQFGPAEEQFVVAAHGYPNSVLARYGLGLARYGLARYAEAIGPLELAAGALPKEPRVHYVLAVCYD
ncbi:MAG: M48 family metalloprotease, partial [Candidatus Brocadiae bacterium]|nr:M48 family metalloprotease [Candidatus Brocadiia bacterium]